MDVLHVVYADFILHLLFLAVMLFLLLLLLLLLLFLLLIKRTTTNTFLWNFCIIFPINQFVSFLFARPLNQLVCLSVRLFVWMSGRPSIRLSCCCWLSGLWMSVDLSVDSWNLSFCMSDRSGSFTGFYLFRSAFTIYDKIRNLLNATTTTTTIIIQNTLHIVSNRTEFSYNTENIK